MGRASRSGTKQVEGRWLRLWRGGGMGRGMQQRHEWTWSQVYSSAWKAVWVGNLTSGEMELDKL